MVRMDRFEELAATFARVAAIAGVELDLAVVRQLADACGWGRRETTEPLLPSAVSHGVPYGISFVLGAGGPELRLFVEPQAGHEGVADFIAAQPGADITRLAGVREPFPRVWYAVAFRPSTTPVYRAYLCLGRHEREPIVARTFARLGVTDAVQRGERDLPTMIGLDLHASPRVKLYVLRPDFLLDHAFARALPGGEQPMGWLSCHFLESAPPRVAWHYSALRHAPDDDDLARRLVGLLERERIDASIYERLRREVPFRHHFVTYQRIAGSPRVTVYLLPEVRRP